jgi:GAF domain-containing protein
MKPPIPLNEHARVELLRQYRILDTSPEPQFDEIAADAAAVCNTPISMITFIDQGRQWMKATVGVKAHEVPREATFCGHTICQSGLFAVPDALADKRFAGNAMVAGDQVRFYAGVPLLSPEGLAIGTLCVLDRVPRTLTPEQVDKLKGLARAVILLLEVRRQ